MDRPLRSGDCSLESINMRMRRGIKRNGDVRVSDPFSCQKFCFIRQRFRMVVQREMMIQRYIPSVDTVGETSLIMIDGELTHAIEKRPRFDDQDEEVYLRDPISDEMREIASKVIAAANKGHLYARVDVIPGDDGLLMLSELEMLEPSLFFPHCLQAVEVFVKGVEKRMAAAQS